MDKDNVSDLTEEFKEYKEKINNMITRLDNLPEKSSSGSRG